MIEEDIDDLQYKIDQINTKLDFLCSKFPQSFVVFHNDCALKECDSKEEAILWIDSQRSKGKNKYKANSIIRDWYILSIKQVPKGMYKCEEKI